MNLLKFIILIFSFLCVDKVNAASTNINHLEHPDMPVFMTETLKTSGFYHARQNQEFPQVPMVHPYNFVMYNRVIFASEQNIPQPLYQNLLDTMGIEGKTEFYIVIQRRHPFEGHELPDSLRPHYALFKEATVDHPNVLDRTFFQETHFEESFIVRMMPDDLALSANAGGVSAHDGLLSPNNYHLIGDVEKPWMFFSYFKTTQGRQLLTLHLILTEDQSTILEGRLVRAEEPYHPTVGALFGRLNALLTNNPYMKAVSELVLRNQLTTQARQWLELGITEQQDLERQKPAFAHIKPMMSKINRLENIASKSQAEQQRYQELRAHFYEALLPEALLQLEQQAPHIDFALQDHINHKAQHLQSGKSPEQWDHEHFMLQDNHQKHRLLLFELRTKYLHYLEQRIIHDIWTYDHHNNREKPAQGTEERRIFDEKNIDYQWRIDDTCAKMHVLREHITAYYEKHFEATRWQADHNRNQDPHDAQGKQEALNASVQENITQRQQMYQKMIDYYHKQQPHLQWAADNDPSSTEKRQTLEMNQRKMNETQQNLQKIR